MKKKEEKKKKVKKRKSSCDPVIPQDLKLHAPFLNVPIIPKSFNPAIQSSHSQNCLQALALKSLVCFGGRYIIFWSRLSLISIVPFIFIFKIKKLKIALVSSKTALQVQISSQQHFQPWNAGTITNMEPQDSLNAPRHNEEIVQSGVMHRLLKSDPPCVTLARGNFLHLDNGQRIFDATGGAAVISVGHNNSR